MKRPGEDGNGKSWPAVGTDNIWNRGLGQLSNVESSPDEDGALGVNETQQ
jgi:hypothetical protein